MNAEVYQLLLKIRNGKKRLSKAQDRSLYLMIRGMEVGGVHLPEAKKKRLQAINTQLDALTHTYAEHMTKSRDAFWHHCTDEKSFPDMPEDEKRHAAEEAKKRKLKGYVFTLQQASYSSIVRHCTDRTIREMFFMADKQVATKAPYDNRPIILKILRLRQEKAKILGYKNFAEYMIDDRMAGNPERAMKFLKTYVQLCKKAARKEMTTLQRFAGLKDLQLWDISFYSYRLRKEKLSLSDEELRPYFQLENVLQGMWDTAEALFGVQLKKRNTKSPDLLSYDVLRHGEHLGIFHMDLFARSGKLAGAWSDCIGDPLLLPKKKRLQPIVVNTLNIGGSPDHRPVLLKHSDVTILWHEFGHALHGFLTEVPYRNLHSGHAEWDFIEVPSQLMENWTWEEEALQRYAHHARTKKPIPKDLLKRLRQNKTFMQGFADLTQSAYGLMDLLLHTKAPPKSVKELDALCQANWRKYLPLPIPKSYRQHASFYHLFGGGYAAGYYGYLWSEQLEADIFEIIKKRGMLNKKIGEKLRKEILSVGTLRKADESFKAFVGREPDPKALLRKKGLL
jgi:peptidyl-dipeptidase Dcp